MNSEPGVRKARGSPRDHVLWHRLKRLQNVSDFLFAKKCCSSFSSFHCKDVLLMIAKVTREKGL